MLLAELEKDYIQPLTRTEKLQLIEDISRMLREEVEPELLKYFKPGQEVGFWSVFNEHRMAEQFQEYVDQGKL